MFFKPKIYSVYTKPDENDAYGKTVFVKEGFNIFAFIFGGLWALFNRLWLIAILLIFISASLEMSGKVQLSIISMLLSLWFGFEAHNFKASKLVRKNFQLADIVIAKNLLEAQQKYFQKNYSIKIRQSSFAMAN